MHHQRAADDFATIRARMEELRRERAVAAGEDMPGEKPPPRRHEGDAERRRRARVEGWPPPWAPTVFARKQRG